MVLAAGHGTRLRPLTEELPKALMPVGDRPILGHALDRLAAARVDRVVVRAALPKTMIGKLSRKDLVAEIRAETEAPPITPS